MKDKIHVDISVWTIIKLILVILSFYLLYLIKDTLALLFIVLVLVATFSPVIESWSKKIGRWPAVLSVILIFLAALALLIYLVVPPVINQTTQFISDLPAFADKYSYLQRYVPTIEENLNTITNSFNDYTGGFISLTASIFGGIVTFIMGFVLFIYLLIDEKGFKYSIVSIFPLEHRERLIEVIKKVANKVGNWFRGQIILASCVAVVYFIGLTIIGVPFAVMLAVLSGVMDFIPVLGPTIAGAIAAFIAFTDSPIKALIVIALYIAVQQLENTFLVPKIMQKAVGLSPIIIIIALLIGAKLMGIVGAALAVPISASLAVVIQEWPTIKKVWEKSEV